MDTLKALDPLAPAFARGVKARLELLKQEGGLYNTDRVAEILDISPQAVIKRHSTGKLLALTLGRRGFRFPALQFNEERRAAVPGLEDVMSALSGHNPWMQNVFFLSPSSRLNDRRPLDVLREGKFEPVIEDGVVLLMAAIAYYVLQCAIINRQGPNSVLASALGRDWKGKLSPAIYLAAIPLAFVSPWIASGLYTLGALLWLIPDRRIERVLEKHQL